MVTLPAPLEKFFPRGGRKRAALFLSISVLYSFGATFLAGIAVARLLSPEDYARRLIVVSLVNLVAVLAGLGLPTVSLKLASARGDKGARKIMSGAVVLAAALFAVSLSIVFLLSGSFEAVYKTRLSFILGLMCVASFIQALGVVGGYWNARKQFVRLIVINLGYGTFYLFSTAILTYFFRLNGVFYALIASMCVQVVLSVYSFRPEKPDWKTIRDLTSAALPVWIQGLIAYVIQNYDKLVLGVFVAKQDLAYYGLASMPLAPILIFSVTVSQVIMPDLSNYFARNESGAAKALFKKAVKYSLVFFLLLGVCVLVAFYLLTHFFLKRYVPANQYIPFMLPVFIVEGAFTMVCSYFLVSAGRLSGALKARAFQAVAVIPIGSVLIYFFGVWGAIAALWLSTALAALLFLAEVRKIH